MQDFSVTETARDKESVKKAIDNHPEIPNSIRSALFDAVDACYNTGEAENYTATVVGTFTPASVVITIDLAVS